MAAPTDAEVRVEVYRLFMGLGRAPVPAELAEALSAEQHQVERSLHRLSDEHLLVLAPGTPYVWMANPFSALPTPYKVTAAGREWFGNCIWDALGIIALLGTDGEVATWCADCGERLTVTVTDAAVTTPAGVVHYAIPASRWWDDIGFN